MPMSQSAQREVCSQGSVGRKLAFQMRAMMRYSGQSCNRTGSWRNIAATLIDLGL